MCTKGATKTHFHFVITSWAAENLNHVAEPFASNYLVDYPTSPPLPFLAYQGNADPYQIDLLHTRRMHG